MSNSDTVALVLDKPSEQACLRFGWVVAAGEGAWDFWGEDWSRVFAPSSRIFVRKNDLLKKA